MLERVGACIEPAYQVLLHRLEPPCRSHRLLGPDFFQYGLHTPESGSWWPSFLNSIRSVPQSARMPRGITRTSAARSVEPFHRKQSLRGRQKKQSTNTVTLKPTVRAYSRTARRAQDAEEQEQPEPYDLEQDDISTTENALPATHEAQLLSPHQQRIEQLLQFEGLVEAGTARSPRDEIWELFIALPDQVPYASKIMQYLAGSTDAEDLNRALSAYATLSVEARTESDYNVAADVASRRKRISLVLEICKEAVGRREGDLCRQTALMGLLRGRLYKSAARLWKQSWGQETALHRYDARQGVEFIHHSKLHVIDESGDLLEIFTATHERLTRVDTLLSDVDRQCLLRVVQGLGWRIVDSARTMAAVNLGGLFATFERLENLGSLTGLHSLHAIRTLCSSRTPRNRHDLATALYRNFRLRYPDQSVPKYILHGLLYLSYKAAESREALEYFLEELRKGHIDWQPRPFQGRPGRDEYVIALRALAWQGDVTATEQLYTRFIADHGTPKKSSEVVPLLYTHAILGDAPAARNAFNKIRTEWHLKRDTICWNILMLAHARSAEPYQAFDILEEMLGRNIKPDSMTYGMLGNICSTVGDDSTVLSLLELASQQGLNLGPMLGHLIEAFCLNGDVEKAEMILDNLEQYRSRGSDQYKSEGSPVRLWNILLRHYAYQSEPLSLVRAQERMKRAGVKSDEMTYGTLMAALIQSNKTHDALKILRSLHFRSTIEATPFLYSLILHGFQRESNRDMTNLIWGEMQARFPAVTPSAKLSMLRSEKERDFAKTRQQILQTGQTKRIDLKNALIFLDRHGRYDPSDKATRTPQPGFQRRKAYEAAPSIFTETVTDVLAKHGKPIQAGHLMDWYDDMMGSDTRKSQNIHNLTSRMLIAARNYQRQAMDRLWLQILHLGIKTSLSPIQLRQSSIAWRTDSTDPVIGMQELLRKMEEANLSIQPARHLELELPLSNYINALNEQGRHPLLISVVDLFPKLGFTLTSKNWNQYIKALCNSLDPEHHVYAFSLFEQVLLPNMPSMRVLTKGLWIEPSVEKAIFDSGEGNAIYVRHRKIERSQPTRPIPSYETTVWLASVAQNLKGKAAQGGLEAECFRMLQQNHREALRRIGFLPFRSDRVQRILLHQKGPIYGPRFTFENLELAGPGITSAESVIDQLPVQSVDWISRALRVRKGHDPAKMAEDITLAEHALGEIVRNPLWLAEERRWESDEELNGRLQRTELEYLQAVEDMERNIKQSPLTMSESSGDPVYRPDWAALADGNTMHDNEASSGLAKTEYKANSPATLDERVDLKAKAKLHTTRMTLPRTRIKNSLALFNPLLPPKPIKSRVDRSFSRAKARRRPRLEEIRREQRWAEQNRDSSAESFEPNADLAVFARMRQEQAQREQELQDSQHKIGQLRQEQAKRISGYLSEASGLGDVQSTWPTSFPLGPAVSPLPPAPAGLFPPVSAPASSVANGAPDQPRRQDRRHVPTDEHLGPGGDSDALSSRFSTFGFSDAVAADADGEAGETADDDGDLATAAAEEEARRGEGDKPPLPWKVPGLPKKQGKGRGEKGDDDGGAGRDETKPFGGWKHGEDGFKF